MIKEKSSGKPDKTKPNQTKPNSPPSNQHNIHTQNNKKIIVGIIQNYVSCSTLLRTKSPWYPMPRDPAATATIAAISFTIVAILMLEILEILININSLFSVVRYMIRVYYETRRREDFECRPTLSYVLL